MALRSWDNTGLANFTAAATGQIQTGMDDNSCQLEQLASRGDFDHLLSLLHQCIWQRFSLSADECPLEWSGKHRGYFPQAEKNSPEFHVSATFDIEQDKENVCAAQYNKSRARMDEHGENPQMASGKPGQQFMEWEFECDPETVNTGYLFTESWDEGKINTTTYYPVPAWFLLSAVFTGCPQLIDTLLRLQNRAIAPEKVEITQVCLEPGEAPRRDERDSAATDVSVVFHNSESLAANVPASSRVARSPGVNRHNQAVKISNQMAEIDVRKLKARRFGCHSFVNARVACEFPITDTWIHQSINLMLSPLHLACWRLDFNAIRTLLRHGADPNGLALEQVSPEFQTALYRLDSQGGERPSLELLQHSPYFLYNGLYFHHSRGLSPLHFLALGLRSPPRHSLLDGCRAGVIHDACATFRALQHHRTTTATSVEMDEGHLPCMTLSFSGESRMEEELAASTKCAMVVRCLEVLLGAGANANVGDNSIFQGAFPLDLILQPPCLVFYAPNAARNTQSSVSLRRYDLEHNVHYVIAVSDVLLRHGARVSPRFASVYSWRPELLDSFHLVDDRSSVQLVSQAIRLGLFPDTFPEGLSSVRATAMIQRFIADVMNKSVPASLTSLILHWCSLPLLHEVSKTITKIAESSGWSENLREVAAVTSGAQHRSLKHSCNYVILKSVGFSYAAVHSLPLPPRLIRELIQLCC